MCATAKTPAGHALLPNKAGTFVSGVHSDDVRPTTKNMRFFRPFFRSNRNVFSTRRVIVVKHVPTRFTRGDMTL